MARSADPPSVEQECRLLARQVFGLTPSEPCIASYRDANIVVFGPEAQRDVMHRRIAEAARLGWDLEALEFALRLRDKSGPLTKKLNILFYLIETTPAGFTLFVNSRRSVTRAWWSLSVQTFRSVYKLLKGLRLRRRLMQLSIPASHD